MRHLTLLFLVLVFTQNISAQECDNQRYYEEIFTVNITADVLFGEAPQPTLSDPDNIQELFMDVYQPNGDTLSSRPLIIWAFGGAFVFGSKESPDIVTLSSSFAQRGYVNAAIDYRLSTNELLDPDSTAFYKATLKAQHDMLASIRYFYKDAATNNQFRIDTTRIYIGGVSAGAITALQIAHYDELEEVPMAIDSIFQATGGFSGQSGNAGYSEDIAGVISLSGFILDTAWISPTVTTPIGSMHGTEDNIAPYGSDTITVLDINLEADGSSSIHYKLDQLGTQNDLYTFHGAGHTPFVSDAAYMDTTIQFVRDFLYDLVCDDLTAIEAAAPSSEPDISIYPNPTQGAFWVEHNLEGSRSLQILDQWGREAYAIADLSSGIHELNLQLPPGMYLVRLFSKETGQTYTRKILIQ